MAKNIYTKLDRAERIAKDLCSVNSLLHIDMTNAEKVMMISTIFNAIEFMENHDNKGSNAKDLPSLQGVVDVLV